MTTVKTVPQILNDAADLLEQEGRWAQGTWHQKCETDNNGVSHCADGAIERASGVVTNFRIGEDGLLDWDRNDDSDVWASYSDAYWAASEHTRGFSGSGIVAYNDADDRTQAEVVAALRGAARQASELVPA